MGIKGDLLANITAEILLYLEIFGNLIGIFKIKKCLRRLLNVSELKMMGFVGIFAFDLPLKDKNKMKVEF